MKKLLSLLLFIVASFESIAQIKSPDLTGDVCITGVITDFALRGFYSNSV